MRRLLPFVLLLGICRPLSAEGEKFSLRTLALTPGEFPQVWTMDSSKPVLLEFSSSQPSEPLRLGRTNPFPIYLSEPGDKGQSADKSPAMLKLPEGPGILLLGLMDQEKPRFLPIADTAFAGKFNDWFVINVSAKQVAIQVGTAVAPVVIEPGARMPLKINQPSGEGAPVTMASKEEKEWRKFFSTYWPVHADKRCLVVIVPNGERIEARLIFEELERAVPKDDG
ncbi:MAG: hypothetical protein V4689_15465 [Verrucomicrobiota bacterium]